MNKEDFEIINDRVRQYTWYHAIKVAEGVYTRSVCPEYKLTWDFSLKCMHNIDFKNKRVLDIGCRDGLFSFEAEKLGAREIIGIDNDLSKGAVEFLIPTFRSKVKMYEMNLYELNPNTFGMFDIVLFLGVLYHLRYPFWGLKKISDVLSTDGFFLIESGMLISKKLADMEIMYCPFERSPYEKSSVTFFNKEGLSATLRSYYFDLISCYTIPQSLSSVIMKIKMKIKTVFMMMKRTVLGKERWKTLPVTRQFLIFRKRGGEKDLDLSRYWDEVHNMHTEYHRLPASSCFRK